MAFEIAMRAQLCLPFRLVEAVDASQCLASVQSM
jgi:hypothetical protein